MKYIIDKDLSVSIKILRSEFIAFLYRVEDLNQAQQLLHEHQARYQNATHNCYAYVLGYNGEIQYYSDAGEPGGTAGKPILNSLLRNELSGVLAVVTRYFGGIKLGVKGLIEAYSQVTSEAIASAGLVEYQKYLRLRLKTSYSYLEGIRHQLEKYHAEELEVQYAEKVQLKIKIPEEEYQELMEFLDGYKALNKLVYFLEE